MGLPTVLFTVEPPVAWITLNRPERLNAIDHETLDGLEDAVQQAEKDERVRVVVLTGAGPKAFCAGADLSLLKEGTTQMQYRKFINRGQRLIERLETMPKVTIAAVNGYALGGGLEIVLGCDVILSADSAKLGQPEINTAGLPGWGGSVRLFNILGAKRAKEVILTGRMIESKEAEAIGLVDHIYPAAEFQAKVKEFAASVAEKSPTAVAFAKRLFAMNRNAGQADALAFEAEVNALCYATKDHEEGVKAFLEKRKPKYTGE